MTSSQGKRLISLIDEHGIPEPWQTFGTMLSKDGSLSTSIVEAVQAARRAPSDASRGEVLRLFDDKLGNLAAALDLLSQVLNEYDEAGTWEQLHSSLDGLDTEEILTFLLDDFGLHAFPIVLQSIRFNWEYMKQHGIRAFYEMTSDYLRKVLRLTSDARLEFQAEIGSGVVKPYWLIRMDLNSIEVPTHCDVCRMSIAPIILLSMEKPARAKALAGSARA